jgi:hypothetical protein
MNFEVGMMPEHEKPIPTDHEIIRSEVIRNTILYKVRK